MTFADLYHLNDKCEEVERQIALKDPYIDEEGYLHLAITVPAYEKLKEALCGCKGLVYELCQTDIKDVINPKGGD